MEGAVGGPGSKNQDVNLKLERFLYQNSNEGQKKDHLELGF